MRTRTVIGLLVVSSAFAFVGCGGSSSSPAAPSSAAPTSAAGSGSATIVGLVKGGGTGMSVAAEGTASSSTVDSAGHFQLIGVPSGDVRLRFTATGVNASTTVPQVAEQQHVEITVAVSGTTATIVADVRGGSGTADSSAEADGMVTSVTGSCPVLTLVIGSTTVGTTAQTTFAGGACADVKTGVTVEAKGTRQAEGSIAAQSVRLEIEDVEVEVEGVVSALSGVCPALAFTVSGTTVRTDASTVYPGGTCADVKAGGSVDVDGTRQTDGSLLAKTLKVENAAQELEGNVTAIDGTAKTFQLLGKTIELTPATVVRHGSTSLQFSDIRVGDLVHVKGTPDAAGAIVASEVNVQNDNPTPPTAEGEQSGTIGAVTGSCPAVGFTVKGTAVTTGPLTTYAGGSCSDIRAGASVEVRGLVQPDKSLSASWIKFDKNGNGKQ
jgi:hypothetical protein